MKRFFVLLAIPASLLMAADHSVYYHATSICQPKNQDYSFAGTSGGDAYQNLRSVTSSSSNKVLDVSCTIPVSTSRTIEEVNVYYQMNQADDFDCELRTEVFNVLEDASYVVLEEWTATTSTSATAGKLPILCPTCSGSTAVINYPAGFGGQTQIDLDSPDYAFWTTFGPLAVRLRCHVPPQSASGESAFFRGLEIKYSN